MTEHYGPRIGKVAWHSFSRRLRLTATPMRTSLGTKGPPLTATHNQRPDIPATLIRLDCTNIRE
jgi:hypothetical protein